MFLPAVIWLVCAVQIVCAVLSLVERRPVGIGWGAKERDQSDDYRVSATISATLGASFAFMLAYDLTHRYLWLEAGCISLGVGLLALIVVGGFQEREGNH